MWELYVRTGGTPNSSACPPVRCSPLAIKAQPLSSSLLTLSQYSVLTEGASSKGSSQFQVYLTTSELHSVFSPASLCKGHMPCPEPFTRHSPAPSLVLQCSADSLANRQARLRSGGRSLCPSVCSHHARRTLLPIGSGSCTRSARC